MPGILTRHPTIHRRYLSRAVQAQPVCTAFRTWEEPVCGVLARLEGEAAGRRVSAHGRSRRSGSVPVPGSLERARILKQKNALPDAVVRKVSGGLDAEREQIGKQILAFLSCLLLRVVPQDSVE